MSDSYIPFRLRRQITVLEPALKREAGMQLLDTQVVAVAVVK